MNKARLKSIRKQIKTHQQQKELHDVMIKALIEEQYTTAEQHLKPGSMCRYKDASTAPQTGRILSLSKDYGQALVVQITNETMLALDMVSFEDIEILTGNTASAAHAALQAVISTAPVSHMPAHILSTLKEPLEAP